MKRSLCAVVIALVAIVPHAYGDTIPTFAITQVTISVGVNSGSGDNVFFTLSGPGTNISGHGGIACFDYCSFNTFPPGTSPPLGIGQIFISTFQSATIGGKSYDPLSDIGFNSIFSATVLGSFTFPTNFNGSTFCVPASVSNSLGGIAGSGETFTQFNLKMPAGGNFCTTWSFDAASGQYQFAQGTFVATTVPEPRGVGLVGLGLAGIIGLMRRKIARLSSLAA